MVALIRPENTILASTSFLAIICNDFGSFKCLFVVNHSIILPFLCGCYNIKILDVAKQKQNTTTGIFNHQSDAPFPFIYKEKQILKTAKA
jgi:hypothetical protein